MLLRSRPLWLFGLTLSLALAAGCGDGDGDNDAMMEVNWDVAYVDNTAVSCPAAGTPWVRLDARSQRTGQMFTFEFNCESYRGRTDTIPSGPYEIFLSLLDGKRRPVASTGGGYFELRRRGVTQVDPVRFQIQSFLVSWLLVLEGMGGSMRPVTSCAEVGVSTVEFSAQLSGEPEGEVFRFNCDPGLGATSAIRVGSYGYQIRLLNAADAPVTTTDVKGPIVVGTDARPRISERFVFKP